MYHSEELCDIYISTGVVRVVKCRRLRWVGCVARMDVSCDVYITTGVARKVKCRRLGWAGYIARMRVS